MNYIKGLLKSRTILFNLVLGLIGAGVVVFGTVENNVGLASGGFVIIGIAGVGVMLRVVTNKPLSEKGIAKSKTAVFNTALGLFGALEAYSGFLQGFFGDQKLFGLFMVTVGTIGFVLRTVTTKPVGEE